ncbi:hypothetical protein, partial [Iamia sp.]|uniref:hypothetical protein n=1 Tax=Iamia sp. TaxID=2722710 RepID=UPI002C74284A
EVFSTEGTQAVFDAIPGRRKRLVFCEGDHDDWPTELIRASVTFINQQLRVGPGGQEEASMLRPRPER